MNKINGEKTGLFMQSGSHASFSPLSLLLLKETKLDLHTYDRFVFILMLQITE